jgi:hypothetical protein
MENVAQESHRFGTALSQLVQYLLNFINLLQLSKSISGAHFLQIAGQDVIGRNLSDAEYGWSLNLGAVQCSREEIILRAGSPKGGV